MSTRYKDHVIKPFQQFAGVWLAYYEGPLTAGTVKGYTRRHATARAKRDILHAARGRADKPFAVMNNELRRASLRTLEQSQALWSARRRLEGLPSQRFSRRVLTAAQTM